jgi:hypothetical protein
MDVSLQSLENIKVKPSTMLIALGGIVVVAYVVTGALYLKQRWEQPRLTEQVTAGGALLTNLGDSQQTVAELKEQLSEVQASVTALDGAIPPELDSAAIVQNLLAQAAQEDVRITQLTGLPPKETKVAGDEAYTYQSLPYAVVADGSLPDLLALLSLIESDTTETAGITDVAVAPAENTYEMKATISYYARLTTEGAASTPGAPGAAAPPTPASPAGQTAGPSGG